MKQFKILSLILASLVSLMLVTSCSDDSSTGSDDGDAPENMVLVKGGSFMMGNVSNNPDGFDHELPVHEVKLNDFYIGKYEVTNKEFCEFLVAQGTTLGEYDGLEVVWIELNEFTNIEEIDGTFKVKENKENYPVYNVTWYGALAYCEWKEGRLPTEAEWEYAARGGNKAGGYEYAGSDNMDEVGWYFDNCDNPDNDIFIGKGTHPVGEKAPNELGIYDMSGNVVEWCSDWFDENYYANSPAENPQGSESGVLKVMRGGGWVYSTLNCRVSDRNYYIPATSDFSTGFRLVMDKK